MGKSREVESGALAGQGMILDTLIGQEKIWKRLVTAYENDHITGAYLFHGPSGVGKEGIAIRFAGLVNCKAGGSALCGECSSCAKFNRLQHPNMTLIVPLPKDRDIKKAVDDTILDPDKIKQQEQQSSQGGASMQQGAPGMTGS